MEDLLKQKCVPCEGGTPPLTLEGVAVFAKLIDPEWNINGNIGIARMFVLPTFPQAVVFVDAVAALAEAEGHHPDFNWSYTKVSISLTTHAAHGLTVNDFIMAKKIDALWTAR